MWFWICEPDWISAFNELINTNKKFKMNIYLNFKLIKIYSDMLNLRGGGGGGVQAYNFGNFNYETRDGLKGKARTRPYLF